ncbi:sugar transferase [Pacificimonas flava]|uniref:Sugar transferase n=2 Tax=Pacificimonas TaxID=1960290 RepID=A0A219B6Z7_9SPHN|nr:MULTISPECIES: TIGR03013 family XrtA/PEP-CTERM system glycosyltransferase [Pacificimonas]MBZ6378679.1 TIGR03013 family PEP-CTERM/XrtA system glycosyltransferase [Pacificimonas aurantium]OWV34051.1 sugar transferase [Pacificimonas flava]
MIRLFRHYFPRPLLFLGLIEIALVFLSGMAAWELRTAQIASGTEPFLERLPNLVAFTVTVYIAMLAVGAYQLSSFRSMRMTIARLVLSLLLSVVFLSLIILFFPAVAFWRSVLLYAILIALVVLAVVRIVFLAAIGWERFREPIVVIGAGDRGENMRRLAEEPTAGFRIVAHFALEAGTGSMSDTDPLDSVPSLADFCFEHDIEHVVLALDERRGKLPARQLLGARLAGVKVIDKTNFIERMSGRVDLGTVSPSWFIFSDGFLGSSSLSLFAKRVFDVSASLLLLLLTSPILILAALAVKLSSRGPIFYRQERVGQLGRTFWITKFRSMVQDAEKDGAQWAKKNDARVTTVGRILRQTRIDEIPQIFNVLTGDMSFVGPRPERPVFVDQLKEQIPFYSERHIVKPGITGWAQLNYPYGASMEDARKKLEYDLYYIKNYTIFLDLVILIQTARVIIWQDGVR